MKNETQNNNIQIMENKKWLLQEPTTFGNRRRVNVEDKEVGLITILVIEDYTDNKKEAESNAKLIVTAVNNFNKLIEFVKRVEKGQWGELKGEFIVNRREEAKQLLKQIEDNKDC